MEHMMTEPILKILKLLEIAASDSQIQSLQRYSEMVLAHNPRVNITGAKDLSTFIEGPLFDALTLLTVVTPAGTFVDIGSGGGLPAVPLCILRPDMQLTLVEPRTKRAAFLKTVIDAFHLNAEVLQTQDRELAQKVFDGASAQAVFPPARWIARARKLVCEGGAIYTLTSVEITPEILPNRVALEVQKTFHRGDVVRYAARLRKTA